MVTGPDRWDGGELPGNPGERPRIPSPRSAAEDRGPLPDPPPLPVRDPVSDSVSPLPEAGSGAEPPAPVPLPDPAPAPPHRVLKSLLGAWALSACSPRRRPPSRRI